MLLRDWQGRFLWAHVFTFLSVSCAWGHGTVVSPESRVHRVYASNPENPSFSLAQNAIQTDGTQSYYTWMELSRNIPETVNAELPAGFDYSPWVPDGTLASGGRVDPNSSVYPRTYAGLDQVSSAWPTSPAQAGDPLAVDFYATTPHDPSVWDVWMTTADWNPSQPLNWAQMEFLGRPTVTLTDMHYQFDVMIPEDRVGHHVLWIAWQRDDPVGEVFFSTSDLMIAAAVPSLAGDYNQDHVVDAADYTVWRNHIGAPAGTLPNDVDGGVIGAAQYARWKANFGKTGGAGSASVSADASFSQVPEPGAWLLAMLSVAVVPWRCGRLSLPLE
jgi:predicted carbohydrate-binding protein with CBM5 and CBM33 domain